MKDIKDYLKYYIGCEVEYEGILNGKELKEEREANKHDWGFIPQVKEVKGKKIGILKEIRTTLSGKQTYRIGRKGLQTHYSGELFKLRLRRLSSMTEEEKTFVERIGDGGPGIQFKFSDGSYSHTWWLCSDRFHYLLSKGFDVFGLIDSNLALEQTTKQQ